MGRVLGSRLGWAGLVAGVVVVLLAGSSGVAAAQKVLGNGCTYYELGETGWPTRCPGWQAPRNIDLSGFDFSHADLTHATLPSADLDDANFTDADLRGAKARNVEMNSGTKLDNARVDHETLWGNLLQRLVVLTATVGEGHEHEHYFILGGVNPGFPGRYQPQAIVHGVFINECTTGEAVAGSVLVNGQAVFVKVLRPGQYRLTCSFFTARNVNEMGFTSFQVNVVASPLPQQGGSG